MRGDAAKSREAAAEHQIFSFLSQVADEASGRLSPAARARLVEGLRQEIQRQCAARGSDAATVRRILEDLGDAPTLVDAELFRDPDYQARLAERLTAPEADGPQEPILDDLAVLLTPGGRGSGPLPGPRPEVGPEICLDPDPFAPERGLETVGALAAETNETMFPQEPDGAGGEPGPALAEVSALAERARTVWTVGPRARPREAFAIALFLAGAIFGFWLILLVGGLVAFSSRFYSPVQKWTLVVGVPVATALCYAVGFWLYRHGDWGGHPATAGDLLSGAVSFFGTLPRIASLLAAMYLSWLVARDVMSRQ